MQVFTEGRLSKDIFGHSSSLPHRDDDFILAIIKYGTATLETTAMKGLNNEVSALSIPSATYVELYQSSNSALSSSMTGSGQVLNRHPSYPLTSTVAHVPNPLKNEVRQINAKPSLPTDIDPMSRNASLRKEIWRFCKALWMLWKLYVVRIFADFTGIRKWVRGDGRTARVLRVMGVQPPSPVRGSSRQESSGQLEAADLKNDRRARATTAQADEDDDLDDSDYINDDADEDGQSEESSSSSESEGDGEDEPTMKADTEDPSNHARSREASPMPGGLEELNCLFDDEIEGEDAASVLLAHLQAGRHSKSPLTRRRYNALLSPSSTSSSSLQNSTQSFSSPPVLALTTAIATRRRQKPDTSTSTTQWNDTSLQTSALCVVCCAEPRCIVFWPCRCLALCNDCRGELASRSTILGGSSLCPCCRAEVQGYSRIMIP